MAIIHCGIWTKIDKFTNQSADFISGKISDIFHNEIIAETVIFKQKEKERVEKRNQNRGKEERGKAVFLLKSVEK